MVIPALLIAAFVAHPWDVSDTPIVDPRLTIVRDTDTRFEMRNVEHLRHWNSFSSDFYLRMAVANGLFPMPPKTPLNVRIFDTLDRDGYAVSKVRFEAFPGFLVTGNLYMPKGEGPFPGVIHPHGHWGGGRLEDTERGSVPARAITFARMGIASFTYDMVGYNDSRQVSRDWGHRFDSIPLEERQRQALWAIHPFALQLWSSIRALDFMQTLPEVDPNRLGCTGASGGGTQTFALCAVDGRVKVAAPVNMISHSMQGGCVCENAPLLRTHASNMEIAAMFAPNPLLMVSATGDWTTETPQVEYPAVRTIYELFNAADRISNVHIDAPHNYNLQSREAVYQHFGTWLLEDPEAYADFHEPAYTVEARDDLRVFPGGAPIEGYDRGDQLIERLVGFRRESRARINKEVTDHELLQALRSAIGTREGSFLYTRNGPEITVDGPGFRQNFFLLQREGSRLQIPAVVFELAEPTDPTPVLIVHSQGKAALSDDNGDPIGAARDWMAKGRSVVLVDIFRTGELAGERRIGKFPDTFMRTDTAYRVHDIATAINWTNHQYSGPAEVVGVGDAGVWVLFAAALVNETGPIHVDFNGFDFNDDAQWVARHYMPSIRALGDIHSAARLIAPRELTVTGLPDGVRFP